MRDLPQKQRALADAIMLKSDSLESFLKASSDKWVREDLVYRFWHQSFKVYALQDCTQRGVDIIRSFAPPGSKLHPFFEEIVEQGTGVVFEMSHNNDWTKHTRAIVEAFWHVTHIVEMMVKHAPSEATQSMEKDVEEDGSFHFISSGWATVLEVFNLR